MTLDLSAAELAIIRRFDDCPSATFSEPMLYAERVGQHDGYAEGDTIAYDRRVYSRGDAHDERVDGRIVELWLDEVRGEQRLYGECLSIPDESPDRVWFWRDHVGPAGSLGAAPDGALW